MRGLRLHDGSRQPCARVARASGAVMLALVIALLLSAPALATSIGERIILRCAHGESQGGFTQRDYNEALRELLADAEEYSWCEQQIREAQIAAAAHGAGSPTAAVARAAIPLVGTAAELRAIANAKHDAQPSVRVAGQLLHLGVMHADVASVLTMLPAPLLAVLSLKLACLLIIAADFLRRRVRAGRPG